MVAGTVGLFSPLETATVAATAAAPVELGPTPLLHKPNEQPAGIIIHVHVFVTMHACNSGGRGGGGGVLIPTDITPCSHTNTL